MIADPGKDKLTKEEKQAARLKGWKRPGSKKERDDLRAERMAEAGGA